MTVERRVTLESGEVFEDVQDVREPNRGDTDLVHIHQNGEKGYRVVDPDDIAEDILVDEHGVPL